MSKVRQRTKGLDSEKSEKKKIGKPSFGQNETHKESLNFFSKCFCTLLFIFVLIGTVALVGFYRAPFKALPITDLSMKVKLEGPFEVNQKLAEGTKIPGLIGPESVAEDSKGNLYTGLDDGRIVRISPSSDGLIGAGEVDTMIKGDLSKKMHAPGAKSGRPFGLRLVQDMLYVADAYYGIYSLNLTSKDVTSIVGPNAIIPKISYPDDLYISKDETFIYFTDVSSKHSFATIMPFFLEGLCDGRVLRYDMKTKEIRTVMSDLCFPNGIQLSGDEKLLFVSETFRYRVRIIDMTTWKTKQFVDLPTSPDNIRPTGKGTYWIASFWSKWNEFLQRYAFLRQIIAGLLPDVAVFRSFEFYSILYEMNDDGEILQSLHDPESKLIKGFTQASTLKDGRLVLGSFFTNYLAITKNKIEAIGNLKNNYFEEF